jgi:septal ring factor EnvC (AmiA/AmiB activator)
MIQENLLQSAVTIRQEYLKVSSNIELYHKRSKEIVSILDKNIESLDKLQKDIKSKKVTDPEKSISKLMEVIKEVEVEGNKLETLMAPMNKEIEKLQKEENELFRTLKEKNPELSDDQIIKEVGDRLRQENL